eukprot:3862416-Alexandrium_andersonii.AAC.1
MPSMRAHRLCAESTPKRPLRAGCVLGSACCARASSETRVPSTQVRARAGVECRNCVPKRCVCVLCAERAKS